MHARHQIASAVSCMLETLESRRLFAVSLVSGVLTVTGGAGSDVINISIGGTHYNVGQNNDPAQSFAVGSVDSIVLNLGDGSNWSFLHHALDPVQINGGAGNDIVEIGIGTGMDNVQAPITFDGGTGPDAAN